MRAGNHFSACRTLRPGVVRVDARLQDFSFPIHSHEHVCIGLMREGELSSRYGLHRRIVGRNDVILVNPGEVHDGRPSGGCGRVYSMLEIDADAYRRICRDAVGREWIELPQPLLRDPETRTALATWLTALCGADRDVELESATVFFGLLSDGADGPCSRRGSRDLATRIRHRLQERGADADGIGALAIEMGVSRYRLVRACKQAFGLTPEDLRRQLRVVHARALLAGHERLADIAAGAGFADQSHMTREFRRLIGLTPAAYRQALQ